MSNLTARVIGAEGRMGKEHVAAFQEVGVTVVEGDADIVSIASPDNTHGACAIQALKRGSHVFCEKPLATSIPDFRVMCRLAQTEGLALWQHFPLRYQPLFMDIKEKIRSFGDIYRIEASYNWGRTDKLFQSWRRDDPDYSLVLGGMIHMIDLVDWLLGEEINIGLHAAIGLNKSAPGFDGEDTVTALCTTETGTICNFTVDGGRGVDSHNHRLLIHGTTGGRTVVNHEPTNKRAAIHDFVNNLEEGEYEMCGVVPTALALCIDDALHECEE